MERDLATQELLSQPDVFADISNAHIFGGRQVIRPDELECLSRGMIYRTPEGKLQQTISDVRMRYKKGGIDIAIIHAENQTGICNTMPVRDLGYIFSNYHEQIKELKRKNRKNGKFYYTKEIGDDQKLVPVITFILYYGKEEWKKPLTIMDLLNLDEKEKEVLAPFLLNHQIHVIHLRDQDSSMIDRYHSDFWHIAKYMSSCGDGHKRKKFVQDTTRKNLHRGELLDVLYALSGDRRYQMIKENIKKKEGDVNMCILAEELEQKGIDQVNQLILQLAQDGRTEDIILSAKDKGFQKKLMKEYGI